MKLRTKILLVVVAALMLIPSAMVYWVATTQSGLRYVASHLRRVGPVTITVGEVRGNLVDGFELQSLRVLHRRSDVQAEGVTGRVELLPLLWLRRITLPELKVARVAVKLLPDPSPQRNWDPHFLPSMLRIDADDVRIVEAHLTLFSGRVLVANNLHGVATVYPKQIRIHRGELDYDATHMVATGAITAARPFGLAGSIDAVYRPKDLPEWHLQSRFEGDLAQLPVTTQIDRPFHAEIAGAAVNLNAAWKYAGHAIVHDFDMQPFGGGKALGIISGELDVGADIQGFTARGSLTPPGLRAGALQVTFDGSYADHHVDVRSASATHPASGSHATVHGGIDVVSGGPRLDLRGEWTHFRWPLAARIPAFTSPQGSYLLTGIKPWQVHAQGDVVAAPWPTIPVVIDGSLAGDALHISAGSAQMFGGSAAFTGDARWDPAESWQLAGHVVHLDPAALRPDVPGSVNFEFSARGAPFGDAGAIEFAMSDLQGQLRHQAARGKGRFTRAAHSLDWQFHAVDLRVGRTRIQLNGGLGARRDLQFAVDADDLSLLDPGAMGRLSARGRIAGTEATPLLLFKARGSDFQWQDHRIASLDADVDIDLAGNGHSQGQVELTGVQIAGRTAQKAAIHLSGSNDAQQIVLNVEAAPLHAAMVAQGAYRGGLWKGKIRNFSVDDTRDLHLRLEAPAALQFSAEQFAAEQLCMKGAVERFCAAGQRQADSAWNLVVSAEALPLRALTAGLSQDVDYDGTISIQGKLGSNARSPVTGALQGQLQQAQLRHRLTNGRDERLALGSGAVSASLGRESFELQLGLDAGPSGNFRGDLHGTRSTADWHDYPIKGALDATTDGLSALDIYVGGIDKATGRLTTRIGISGTLGQPVIAGSLQLRDATIDVYQVDLSLRELSLDATFDANALDLSGHSRVGDGHTRFNGKLAWRNAEPFGDLHVEGEHLRLVNVPEARIDASPRLDFRLNGHRVEARGEVQIPYARLEPADLTNAVLPSGDEVLVGAPPEDPTRRWTVISDIRMVLGDQVNMNSLGLTARLGGNLVVRTDESRISRGQGELNIAEGKYSALGRQLDIERGRLIFNNVPLGDPGVDLRAQKVFPDITAGVNVRGSLRAPRMTFFSEPAKPQSQIASLILAGGSLESLQDSTRAGAARNDLLAQGGAILAQQVGTRVGVDDVGIESDLSNETSLVLGKYLSPRLYVSYGISLAEAINTLKLRYTIGDKWTIKTEAGKQRSADIVYTIQK